MEHHLHSPQDNSFHYTWYEILYKFFAFKFMMLSSLPTQVSTNSLPK